MNSNPQLREILFEKLDLRVIKRTKTGPSTDASALEELAARGHTLPRHLLEYRQLEKLRSTYVDALPKLVNPATWQDPHVIQSDGRSNRPPLLIGSQSPEHSDSVGDRAPDPKGLHTRRRTPLPHGGLLTS